jgi:hypothetical protein
MWMEAEGETPSTFKIKKERLGPQKRVQSCKQLPSPHRALDSELRLVAQLSMRTVVNGSSFIFILVV